MRERYGVLLSLATYLFSLAGTVDAETLDTTPAWNGTTYISSFGVPNTATYGQTITPTATQNRLQDFTFYLAQTSGTPTQTQAFVYEWNPTTNRIVGSALYQSAVFTSPSGAAFSPVTINTGGVMLVSGTQYVLFFTTSTVSPQAAASYRWGSTAGNPYSGGTFVFQNNASSFSTLSTTGWSTIFSDLAFRLTFDDLTFEDLSHSGELGTAAVSSGLLSAGMFLGQISDPFVTEAGVPLSAPSRPELLGYFPASAPVASVAALAALGGERPAERADTQRWSTTGNQSTWSMWGAAYGGAQNIDGNSETGTADVRTANWGLTTGFTSTFDEGRIGFALGGGGSTFSLDDDLGNGHSGVFNAGAYGSRTFGSAYLSASGGYAFNNVDTSRSVGGDNLTADFNAHTLFGRIEAGYRNETPVAIVTPFAALQGAGYFMPSYSEKSSGTGVVAVDYNSETETALRTEIGARLEHVVPTEGGNVRLTGRIAWGWNAKTARSVTASYQNLAAPSFTVEGAEPGRNALLFDAGAEFAVRTNVSVNVALNAEYSGDDIVYGGSAKLKYRW